MSALGDLFSKTNLQDQWKSLKSNFRKDTAPGVDGTSKRDFEKNIESEIEFISKRILTGNFQFSPLKPIGIPKENGGIRLINVPTLRDRFIQRVLLQFLTKKYAVRWQIPNSYSSMKGMDQGVPFMLKNASEVIGFDDYIIKADLSKYFDNIDRNTLKKQISRLVRDRSLHKLLHMAIDSETSLDTKHKREVFNKSGLTKGIGIRQGMPLSPLFAYLFLLDVDTKVSGLYFRYVDDLLFVAQSKKDVKNLFLTYKEHAEQKGLQIHPLANSGKNSKTKLIGPKESVEFLGILLSRSEYRNRFLIPRESRKKIKTEIKASLSLEDLSIREQQGWVLSSSSRVANLISNYRSAYGACENWKEFEDELKDFQMFLCREVVRNLAMIERNSILLRRVFNL